MRRTPTLLACLALSVAASVWCAGAALAAGYPRLGLYGGIRGNGYPYILDTDMNPRTDPLDFATCDSVARYDQVILDASPITEYRRDILSALRTRHLGIQLLAYVNADNIWPAAQPDSTVHYPTRFRRLVRKLNGFLYDRAGREYPDYNVNYAKKDAQGRYVVAESLAVLFHDALVKPGIWDGMFLDVFCNRVGWTQSPAESIDFRKAGYSTLAAFDAAYEAGSDVLAQRLRALVGNSFLLVGNCGQGTKYTLFNGWMRENFPNQNGGNWYENMFRTPGGYFTDEAKFKPPRQNYIFTAAEPFYIPYATNNARKARFGLGSASLGDGFGTFGYSVRDVGHTNYSGWWYDEFAVDLSTGQATDRAANTGWLGQPLGPAAQMIWLGSGPDASTNPDFEASVTSGWTFVANLVTATLSRDTGTAATGTASARVHVLAAGTYDWLVNLNTTGAIPITAGGTYSATFYAKASSPRPLPVILGLQGGAEVAQRTVNLTTSWQRFQVQLIPGTSGLGRLSFFLAGAAGDIWIDGAHLQAGVTSIWRRDFQNGIVLVNPWTSPLTVDLGRNFRRIAGFRDPAVNDGLTGSQITIGGQDARFLMGSDVQPPAPVNDLHVVPR